jgi:hypothetical protein
MQLIERGMCTTLSYLFFIVHRTGGSSNQWIESLIDIQGVNL